MPPVPPERIAASPLLALVRRMTLSIFDSLSPGERTALGLLLEEGDQKAVARRLGVSPETVKTHLRNAREKTGIGSSFALARALARGQTPTPFRGIPGQGGATASSAAPMHGAKDSRRNDDGDRPGLSEAHVRLDLDRPASSSTGGTGGWRHAPSPMLRLVAVGGLVLIISLVIILAFPLSESFQRLADKLDPQKH